MVAHATVYTDTWTAVNNILISLFPTKNIYAKFPDDTTKIKKSDFPIVVQMPAKVESKEIFFGRTPNAKEINIIVEIYASNPADIDSYSQTIRNYFETTVVSTLHQCVVTDSSVDTLQVNAINVAFRVLNLSFVFK